MAPIMATTSSNSTFQGLSCGWDWVRVSYATSRLQLPPADCLMRGPQILTHGNHPRVLLKSTFWFTRSGVGLRVCISNKFSGDARAVPRVTVWVARDHAQVCWECHTCVMLVVMGQLLWMPKAAIPSPNWPLRDSTPERTLWKTGNRLH